MCLIHVFANWIRYEGGGINSYEANLSNNILTYYLIEKKINTLKYIQDLY